MKNYRQIHDVLNVYKFGEKIKVVYIKNAVRRIKVEGYEEHYSNENIIENKETATRFDSSLSRTRSKIFELCMCNEFDFFCTFTFDKKKVNDRYNLTGLHKTLSQFIRNENRKRTENNKILYVLIPEKHKKGGWHLHGVIKGLSLENDLREFTLSEKLPNRIREKLQEGEKIYNWEKYSSKFGYFTATKIRDKTACSGYVCKYITKAVEEQGRAAGNHLFFASQGLNRKEVLFHESRDEANNRIDFARLSDRWDFVDETKNIKVCKNPSLTEWGFENEYVKLKWYENLTDFGNALLSQKQDT